MIIVDAHQNIAYNALGLRRDYTLSAWHKRRLEAGYGYPTAIAGLPDAILGRVAVVFASLFVVPSAANWQVRWRQQDYDSPQTAYRLAMQQMDYYARLEDDHEKIRLIRERSDLDTLLETWSADSELLDHQQGLVIAMEGADPVLEPRQFEAWHERGVKVVAPAWLSTRYAAGMGLSGSLTGLGYELLEVMANYQTILDVSHLSERAFVESVDHYDGPIIASHSNPRHFCDTHRHLSDEMILRLIERDGVIGIIPYNRFLSKRWTPGDPTNKVTLAHYVDVIDHICQLAGSAAHVGIGSDFDNGFYGADGLPDDLDTVTDLLAIGDAMRERGFAENDIEAVLGRNMLRKLRQCLGD